MQQRARPELRLSVVVFLVLRHRVAVGGRMGAPHNHACSVEAEVTPLAGDTIPFAEVEAELKSQITPFDGKALNDLDDFRGINPTIESFATHIFDRLDYVSTKYGAVLNSVTVRESPTRAVRIVRPDEAAFGGRQIMGHWGGAADKSAHPADLRGGIISEESREKLCGEGAESSAAVSPDRGTEGSRSVLPYPGQTRSSPNQRAGCDPDVAFECPTTEAPIQSEPDCEGRPQEDDLTIENRTTVVDKRPRLAVCLAVCAFIAVTILIYRKLLWPPPGEGFPWGSDTWSHIRKAEFLLQEVLRGNYFPNFSPMWYNGVEPFRHWAPLPYYLLAGLIRFLRDPFLAAGWYVALCALLGGLGWLLLKDRLGFAGASFAGFIWLFWQDNVRVAMSEGNLPRVLATSLFPYLLHSFLLAVEKPPMRSMVRFSVLACIAGVTIISHAMMAATFFIGLTTVGTFWVFRNGIRSKDLGFGILAIFAGIGLSAWWLVPSLQNGIVSIDKEAISEAMQFFPFFVSMNPLVRVSQPETFYWGISLAAVSLAVLLTWKQRGALSQSSVCAGILFVAASTPTFRPVYRSVPFHHLIFPLYFATVASGIFLVAAFSWNACPHTTKRDRRVRIGVTLVLLVILILDSCASTRMITTRAEPSHLTELADHMPSGGWREATLDLSSFGSAATYILAQDSGRELVYGWAWQGATTGPNIVSLNTALQSGYYPFVLDRLVELGTTHIVARRGIVDEDKFLSEADKCGFTEAWRSVEGIVLVADGGPYALKTEYSGVVIGKSAANWASLFPSLACGKSTRIDSYAYEDLAPYPVIVVSGATWEDRTRAEDLLSRLAGSGHRVVVDMEGLPEDVLSKRPRFLGVVGEPIMLYRSPTIYAPGVESSVGAMMAFDGRYYPWKAHSPQGVDEVELEFPYLGETVTVLGSRAVGGGKIWFIGANLPYHAYLTRDTYAIEILSSTLELEPGAAPKRTKIPLRDYIAGAGGYSFGVHVSEPDPVTVTIPIAARDNMVVTVDGGQAEYGSLHNLITVRLDPGVHSIAILPQYPSSLGPAVWVSVGCALFLATLLIRQVMAALKVRTGGRVVSK